MLEHIQYDEHLSVKVQLLNIHNYPIHNHKDFQILYVLEGELSLKLFYATYRLQPGSIHIIHSEDVHSIKSITDDNLVLVLSFNSSYFQSIFPHFITTVFITNIEEGAFEKRDALCNDIFTIAAETCDKTTGYISRINNTAVSLINTLMHNFRGFVIDPNGKSFIHKTSHDYMQVDRISRVIQYVYEHYPYKISLSEIAEKEQVSTYYLSHIFHKLVGINFRDFLSMVRVEMSEATILSTTKSIAQVAQDMGFSDAKYYVKHFHDHLGCHPKEYRKKYSQQVLGKIQPDIVEYPLSSMKKITCEYSQNNVFKNSTNRIYHIALNFTAEPIGKFKKVHNVFSVIGYDNINISPIYNERNVDFSALYQNMIPHETTIKIMQDLINHPDTFQFPQIKMIDRLNYTSGIWAINGLNKPMYYLLQILEQLPEEIINSGDNYIAFQNITDKYLLIFNPNIDDAITVDVIVRNITSNYKMKKTTLRANRSFLHFWSQLNFSTHISPDDINIINNMSCPDIEFEILPKTEQYYTSIEVSPHDIILLTFNEFA